MPKREEVYKLYKPYELIFLHFIRFSNYKGVFLS